MAAQERHRPHRPDAVARGLHAVSLVAFLGVCVTAEGDGWRSWHTAFGHVLAVAVLAWVVGARVWPRKRLEPGWRSLRGAWRRLGQGQAGALRLATCSVAGRAALVCSILVLVPACFVSGWMLGRLVGALPGPVGVHRWLGHALMFAVASHVALVAVLRVLRDRSPRGPGAIG